MSSISSMAMSGMQYAAAQAQTSANTIANASAGSASDLAEVVVQQAAAATNVSMSLQMIRADHDAVQQLVDILV